MDRLEFLKKFTPDNVCEEPGDLNTARIQTDGYPEPLRVTDLAVEDCGVEVFFRDLTEQCCRFIAEFDYIVGCVAWLTDPDILNELAKKQGVAIVVQKEDFLRPDSVYTDDWAAYLFGLYGRLSNDFSRYHTFEGTVLHMMSYCNDPAWGHSVRCVGNHNQDKKPAFPRMHNKFLIGCKAVYREDQLEYQQHHIDQHLETLEAHCEFGHDNKIYQIPDPSEYQPPYLEPVKVWTGSFNLTRNAGNSFENAVVFDNQGIARAYYQEFAQIAALSEELKWEVPWMAPQWRIGS